MTFSIPGCYFKRVTIVVLDSHAPTSIVPSNPESHVHEYITDATEVKGAYIAAAIDYLRFRFVDTVGCAPERTRFGLISTTAEQCVSERRVAGSSNCC